MELAIPAGCVILLLGSSLQRTPIKWECGLDKASLGTKSLAFPQSKRYPYRGPALRGIHSRSLFYGRPPLKCGISNASCNTLRLISPWWVFTPAP